MEDSHYFLKAIGLESYMNNGKTFCESIGRDEIDNLDYSPLAFGENESRLKINKLEEETLEKEQETEKDDLPDKQEQGISDAMSQMMAQVEADDFFSSLELQSSAKTISPGLLTMSFQNKPMSGIVTRSRSLLSTNQDSSKIIESKNSSKMVVRTGKNVKPKKSRLKRVKKVEGSKKKIRKSKKKKGSKKVKNSLESLESKSHQQHHLQCSGKTNENVLKNRKNEEDDWMFLQQLEVKKEVNEGKLFTNKQLLTNDLTNPVRRSIPELFSMSPILMSDVMSEEKDEVSDLLEGDYDDSFLEGIDEYSNGPPQSHTGGKWKPGSLPARASPMLWESQNWEMLSDDGSHEENGKIRSETLADCPTAVRGDGKCSFMSSGKSKLNNSLATYSGSKWKPTDSNQRTKKIEEETFLSHSVEKWKKEWNCGGHSTLRPPMCHTGGKWKPNSTVLPSEIGSYENESARSTSLKLADLKSNRFSSDLANDKWLSRSKKSTLSESALNAMAAYQSTSGKHMKTSGGTVQYFCFPCNRRLSSKKMFGKHVQSDLHLKRVLQESDLEFDSRSLKIYRGLFAPVNLNDRGVGKRVVKKPDMYKSDEGVNPKSEKKKCLMASVVKVKGKKISRKEMIKCGICRIRIPSYQLGKHLVSYYHTRRSQLNDPRQRDLILNNIRAIVNQAPYQCSMCKFYCNSHVIFKKHWILPVHKELEDSEKNHRFWCALCDFECDTAKSMELHLDSNSHREVIQAVNRSIPIIIRRKQIFRCDVCFREFRFNRELLCHQQTYHPERVSNEKSKHICTLCQRRCKGMKSLQKHIIRYHKEEGKVPYFCSVCNEFFGSATEAKDHRNGQSHKYKKACTEKGEAIIKDLSRSCPYCRETLEDLEKFKAHLLTCHRPLLPKCMKCGKVFALSQEMSLHVRKNECRFPVEESLIKSLSLKCEICPFSTDLKSEFLLHTAIHNKKDDGERKITCPLCKSLFTQSALGIHLRTHFKEETYKCPMCPSTFVRKDRYSAHLKMKHFSEDAASSKSETENLLKEPKNLHEKPENRQTNDVLRSRREKKESSDKLLCEKRQICGDPKCKFAAKDAKDLEQHSLIHIGPKMYQCPECPYFGKTNTIIKRHYMIHLGEKQYSCPHCPFKGRLNSHLKRHLRLHTGAKPYKCPHCPYTCNILENLRKHILFTKIHPGKKIYQCKLCTFDTNVSKEFKSHLIDRHEKDSREADAIVAAGVYNKNEDVASTLNPIRQRTKTAKRKLSPKQPSEELKNKIEVLAQSYTPIAPKPEQKGEDLSFKRTVGGFVEDKRKLVELELEKLKPSIKPETHKTVLKSYPSPAKKTFRAKRLMTEEGHSGAEAESQAEITASAQGRCQQEDKEEEEEIIENDVDGDEKILIQDGNVMLVVPPPTSTSSGDEAFSKIGLQSMKLSPTTYILCDDEMETRVSRDFYSIDVDYEI